MSFGRHRVREETPKEEVKLKRTVISPPKKETATVLVEKQPIVETKPEVVEELPVIVVEEKKEEVIEVTKEIEAAAEEVIQKIEKEEIKPLAKKDKKKREDKKNPNLIGVVGQTVVVNDFRAIVKKKGKQINEILNDILHKWNTDNYNL